MDNLSQIGSISLTKGLCHSFSEINSFSGFETIRFDTLDKFFPLFLTIILASFPSGLVVYWTVNNILTIAQQWVINKNTTVKTN